MGKEYRLGGKRKIRRGKDGNRRDDWEGKEWGRIGEKRKEVIDGKG
jgi:hypothetical protein